MKKMIINACCVALGLSFPGLSNGQTTGTLNFSYTPVSHSGYQGTKNVLAVWIQDASGNFVKTNLRYTGSNTKDHLPTWAVNSGGTANNALSTNCNVVGATTGATLSSFTPKSITWDGTNASGNQVADGTYKVTIQSTWNHGSGGTSTRSFTFIKGASIDNPSFTDDANFTSNTLTWTPTGSSASIAETELKGVNLFPVPSSTGFVTVQFQSATNITVYDIQGNLVKEQKIENQTGSVQLDMNSFENGTYLIIVTDGNLSSKHSIVLSK